MLGETQHFNPCKKKIMFPLLRQSSKSKQSRAQSMKNDHSKNAFTSFSETPDKQPKRTCSEGKKSQSSTV